MASNPTHRVSRLADLPLASTLEVRHMYVCVHAWCVINIPVL